MEKVVHFTINDFENQEGTVLVNFESNNRKWTAEFKPRHLIAEGNEIAEDEENSENEEDQPKIEKFSAFLKLHPDADNKPTKVRFSFTVAGVKKTTTKIFPGGQAANNTSWGFAGIVKRSDAVKSCNINGALKIILKLQGWFTTPQTYRPQHGVLYLLAQKFRTMDGWDVCFIFEGGVRVTAHYNVISLTCPQLQEIVDDACDKENVVLENTDPNLFKSMIGFIYTETLLSDFSLEKEAVELLVSKAEQQTKKTGFFNN